MNKYFLYFRYVVRHKIAVFRAGGPCEVNLWRRVKHDFSKFLPSEFFPYAEYFYGKHSYKKEGETGKNSFENTLVATEAFERAWLKHIHRNDHHFEHWIVLNDGLPEGKSMPEAAWRELCADYLGMEYTLNKNWDAMNWYSKNSSNIILHPETRIKVESLLKRAAYKLSNK